MTVWGKFSLNFDNKIKVDWSVGGGGGTEGVKIRKKLGDKFSDRNRLSQGPDIQFTQTDICFVQRT